LIPLGNRLLKSRGILLKIAPVVASPDSVGYGLATAKQVSCRDQIPFIRFESIFRKAETHWRSGSEDTRPQADDCRLDYCCLTSLLSSLVPTVPGMGWHSPNRF